MWTARAASPATPPKHAGDIGAGEAIVTVADLLLRLDQGRRLPALKGCELAVCGVTRLVRQLARGQRGPVISDAACWHRAGRRRMLRPWRYRGCCHSSMMQKHSSRQAGSIEAVRKHRSYVAITVFILYQLRSRSSARVRQYAESWRPSFEMGGDLSAMDAAEGTEQTLLALISFESSQPYESYRARLQRRQRGMRIRFRRANNINPAEERNVSADR